MYKKWFFQENGDRLYKLENSSVILQSLTVDTAKLWNNRYKTNIYDSKFILMLALDIFGLDCLARSSVFGGRSWNSDIQHAALDKVKRKFLEGNVTICHLCQNYFRCAPANSCLVLFIYLTDLFDQRVCSNAERANKFVSILNRHCANARR